MKIKTRDECFYYHLARDWVERKFRFENFILLEGEIRIPCLMIHVKDL
jgi:hypothetical protein